MRIETRGVIVFAILALVSSYWTLAMGGVALLWLPLGIGVLVGGLLVAVRKREAMTFLLQLFLVFLFVLRPSGLTFAQVTLATAVAYMAPILARLIRSRSLAQRPGEAASSCDGGK